MHDKQRLTITSSAAGVVADAFTKPFQGKLSGVYLELGDLTSGAVDFVITEAETGAAVLTITNAAASAWFKPMIPAYTTAGVASTVPILEPLPIDGTFKIVTTGAGNSHTGYLTFYVD